MEPHEISLGKKVRFVFSLDRKREGSSRTWRKWAMRADLVREGIVVGLRTLQNGEMDTEMDPDSLQYGVTYFACSQSFRAALVSTNLYRKPILVALDDLLPAE